MLQKCGKSNITLKKITAYNEVFPLRKVTVFTDSSPLPTLPSPPQKDTNPNK